MNLQEIVDLANTLSDEDIMTSEAIGFLNGAIAKINIECKAKFPYFDMNTAGSDYEGFSEDWQHTLLVPYVVGRTKQKDSSQFEYSDAYSEFVANLMMFRSSYPIPEEYKQTNVKTHGIEDLSTSYWGW